MTENIEKEAAKRFHYTPKVDIMILKQVLENLPSNAQFGQTIERWKEVDDILKLGNGWKGIRSRIQKLVKEFKCQNMESLKKSGVEEEYEEREILLQELIDISKEKNIISIDNSREIGKFMRETALNDYRERSKETLKRKPRIEQLNDIFSKQTVEENELDWGRN